MLGDRGRDLVAADGPTLANYVRMLFHLAGWSAPVRTALRREMTRLEAAYSLGVADRRQLMAMVEVW
jgi:hypothetical protein